MKRAKQILAMLLSLALLLMLGGVAEEPMEAAEPVAENVEEAPAEPASEVAEPAPEEEAAEPEAEPAQKPAEEIPELDAPETLPEEFSAVVIAAEEDEEGEEDENPLILYPETLTMCVGESCKQKVSGAADKKFTYSTSNSKIVSVSSDGKLKAKLVGSATVTVKGNTTRRSVKCKVTVKQAPSTLTLNKNSGKLDLDDTRTLTATIKPSKAPQDVTWKSSNTKIATVEDGEITAVGEGSCTITCTAKKKDEYGKAVSDSYKLTVVDPAKPATLTIEGKATRTLNLSDTLSLEATMEPDTAECDVVWSSSNKKIATVEDGEVTPLQEGTVTIKAITSIKGQGGKKLYDTVKVTIVDPAKPAGIALSVKDNKPLLCYIDDEPLTLEYDLLPTTKTEPESEVTWKSSNKKIAKVSEEGEVEAVKAGSVTITVTTKKKGPKGKKLSDSVKVVVIDPTKPMAIELDQTGTVELPKGETLQLEATITPDTASEAKLTWSSSNKSVAKVSQDGEVTAKKKGTAKITVKTKNGKKASVKIKVVPAEE